MPQNKRSTPAGGIGALKSFTAAGLRAGYRFVRRTSGWKLASMALGGALLLGLLTLGFIYLRAIGGAYGPMPDHAALLAVENSEASSVISEDDKVIAKYYSVNRLSVPLSAIASCVKDALIATEDARFFEHQGIDARALGRVIVKTLMMQHRSSGGGSTISQQLAKQLFPRRDNGMGSILKTKIREMIIASRLEKAYGKDELLALYLNTVPFGENAYGIEVAANRFFSKRAAELKTEEAAVLVGLLKANTTYNPRAHPERSRERRDVVLALMARNGKLTPAQSDSLQALELKTTYRRYNEAVGSAPHFRAVLRREVEKVLAETEGPGGRPYDIDRDGLKIHTSINSHLQRYAEQSVREQLPLIQASFTRDWRGVGQLPWEAALRSAVKRSERYRALADAGLDSRAIDAELARPRRMTVYDPTTVSSIDTTMSSLDSLRHYFTLLNAGLLVTQGRDGVVRAWVGGVDYRFVQYDHVRARRQVGSTIKPIVYATALREGMQPCEYTPAAQFTVENFQDYTPRNPGGKYEGAYSMRGGLAKSVNTVAVNVAVRSGLDRVAEQVRMMGIEGEVEAIPSLALGTVEASLPEMNTAYSAFPSGGLRPEGIHFLDKITTADGRVIVEFERPTKTRRVLDERSAGLATYMMEGVVNTGTGAKLRGTYGLSGPLAGKTGTTQNQSDGWFVGFTPKLVVSSWVGAEFPAVHFRTLARGSATKTALPIWGTFMRKVQQSRGLKFYKGGSFSQLDKMASAQVQCPDYLEEIPILLASNETGGAGEQVDVRTLLRRFTNEEIERMMARKRRRGSESATEYAIRIARYLERERQQDPRRKRKKDHWVKRLFGGGR